MSSRRMIFVERMDIFKLLYFENLKSAQIGQRLNRSSSSITRELKRALDNGIYNPLIAESWYLTQRKTQQPHLKMTSEAWNIAKPLLELRWPLSTISGKVHFLGNEGTPRLTS